MCGGRSLRRRRSAAVLAVGGGSGFCFSFLGRLEGLREGLGAAQDQAQEGGGGRSGAPGETETKVRRRVRADVIGTMTLAEGEKESVEGGFEGLGAE